MTTGEITTLINQPRVYVAAPYTQPDPCANTNRACKAADELLRFQMVPFIPHLYHLWNTVSPKPYTTWMALCREELSRCDAVLRLPGESPGADEECALARTLNIPVFNSVFSLLEAFGVVVPKTSEQAFFERESYGR